MGNQKLFIWNGSTCMRLKMSSMCVCDLVCVCISWLWVGPLAHNLSWLMGQWFWKKCSEPQPDSHSHKPQHPLPHYLAKLYIKTHTRKKETPRQCDTHHNKHNSHKLNTCVCVRMCEGCGSFALMKFYGKTRRLILTQTIWQRRCLISGAMSHRRTDCVCVWSHVHFTHVMG